jgi:hypothetical protein
MPLIWRGFGIAVPIIVFITGWLVGLISGETDMRIGNANFMGWTTLFSGIVVLLLGLGTWNSEGTDENGNKVKKKHDFFYVPIAIWGAILIALSIYLLAFAGKSSTPATAEGNANDSTVTTPTAAPGLRIVNFYNSTQDSLLYIVADETGAGLVEKAMVPPHQVVQTELTEGTYLLIGRDQKNEATLDFPDEEYAADSTKYTLFEDDKGQFFQRILRPATKDGNDYDEAWIMLDGKTNLLLLNVSAVSKAEVTKAEIEKTPWEAQIQATFSPRDLIEPNLKPTASGKRLRVYAPGEKIDPKAADESYLLVADPGSKNRQAMLAKAVVAARF